MDGSIFSQEDTLASAQEKLRQDHYPIVFGFIDALRPHEEVDTEYAEGLLLSILRSGYWTTPLVVETHSRVILDGHHRFWCAQQIGLLGVPVIRVEYGDPNLSLTSWREGHNITPADVLEAAGNGNLLPHKTSRHDFAEALPPCKTRLSDLRWANVA